MIINKPLVYIGTICSIVSVVCLCFSNNAASLIALGTLCLALLLVLIAIIRVLNRFLEKDVSGNYRCISSFVTYRTDDGDNVTFDVHKLIQVKCAIMQTFDTGFKWTGEMEPVWKSDLQEVVTVNKNNDAGKYDTLQLRFKNPPLYNQTTVVHFQSQINDVNRTSKPQVEIRVEYPADYIQIVVDLGYKTKGKPAVISRKLIHSDLASEYENIDSVSFDAIHKQYIYRCPNPQTGYFYRISWER